MISHSGVCQTTEGDSERHRQADEEFTNTHDILEANRELLETGS